MYQSGASFYGRSHMHGFHHFLLIYSPLQTILGVGINTIGTLDSMGDRQGDKGFFPRTELSFLKNRVVIFKKFLSQGFIPVGDATKFPKIGWIIIGI